jgi:predicted  nucleic acid-binding Zn-ribbon protein
MKEGSLEERVARIEGILEWMDKRLNHLESEIRDLRVEIRDLRAYVEGEIKGLRNEIMSEIGDLRRDLNNRFLWILGVLILKLSKPRPFKGGRGHYNVGHDNISDTD